MSKCTDYWCEHYGKANAQCDHCPKKDNAQQDTPELRVILQRRANDLMELGKTPSKSRGLDSIAWDKCDRPFRAD